MPLLYGLLAGLALGRWGVIGLFTWLVGVGLVGRIVGANTTYAIGNWTGAVLAIGLFAWAMWRPSESEAKLGLLRALRLLVGIGMVVTGVVGFVLFAVHGFRISTPQFETWFFLGISAVCWLILFCFRKWLTLDLERLARVD